MSAPERSRNIFKIGEVKGQYNISRGGRDQDNFEKNPGFGDSKMQVPT